MRYLSRVIVSLLLLHSFASANQNTVPGEVLFTQQVVALDEKNNEYPSVRIEPDRVDGLRSHTYDMGEHGSLMIMTNIQEIEFRGLPELVKGVEHAYQFIHRETGRYPKSGVLLYIIEMDQVPLAYTFQASYPDDAGWSEVRLALVRRGEPLFGSDAAQSVSELVYDTIPHELTHDVLAGLHSLPHDLNGRSSYHTRWFIEGVCELLAKRFAHEEGGFAWRRFLRLRHVERVLVDETVRRSLFNWSQFNQNGMNLESDLYGAAMLVLMEWTRMVDLRLLLNRIDNSPRPLNGSDLQALLETTTGHDVEWVMDQGHLIGRGLMVDDNLATYQAE